ncbi:hypothetical protein DIPPA_21856 [Diplonema papillatum]|nr:hypothetical protein DIPPA_21856 [Diplonema papillatum]
MEQQWSEAEERRTVEDTCCDLAVGEYFLSKGLDSVDSRTLAAGERLHRICSKRKEEREHSLFRQWDSRVQFMSSRWEAMEKKIETMAHLCQAETERHGKETTDFKRELFSVLERREAIQDQWQKEMQEMRLSKDNEMSALQHQVDSLHRELRESREVNATLESKLKDTTTKNEAVQQRTIELQSGLDEERRRTEDILGRCKKETASLLEEKERSLDDLRRRLDAAEDSCRDEESQKLSETHRVSSLAKENKTLSQKVEDLQRQLLAQQDASAETSRRMQMESQQAQAALQEERQQRSSAEERSREKCAALEAAKEAALRRCAEVEGALKDREAKVASLEQSLAQCRQDAAHSERRCAELREDLQRACGKSDKLEETVRETQSRLQKEFLGQILQEKEAAHGAKAETLAKLEAANANLASLKRELAGSKDASEREVGDLRERAKEERRIIDSLRKELHDMGSELDQTKRTLRDFEDENARKTVLMSNLEASYTCLQDELASRENDQQSLDETQTQQLQEKIQELQQQYGEKLAASQKVYAEQEVVVVSLKTELETEKVTACSKEAALSALHAEVALLKAEVRDIREERDSLKETLAMGRYNAMDSILRTTRPVLTHAEADELRREVKESELVKTMLKCNIDYLHTSALQAHDVLSDLLTCLPNIPPLEEVEYGALEEVHCHLSALLRDTVRAHIESRKRDRVTDNVEQPALVDSNLNELSAEQTGTPTVTATNIEHITASFCSNASIVADMRASTTPIIAGPNKLPSRRPQSRPSKLETQHSSAPTQRMFAARPASLDRRPPPRRPSRSQDSDDYKTGNLVRFGGRYCTSPAPRHP